MEFLTLILCICLFFGIGYPVVAILLYPLYTAIGGKKNLREYIKNL